LSATTDSPEQFDAGYRDAELPPEAREKSADTGALALKLMAEYKDAAAARELVNLRWLDDLKAYKGQYDEKILAHLKAAKRSQVYYRLTTAKVNTMAARLMDLLFPQRSKNWSLDNTPDPMLPKDVIMDALKDEIAAAAQAMLEGQMQQLAAQNVMPDDLAAQKMQQSAFEAAFAQLNTPEARLRIAKERAAAMERVIDDQLKECSVGNTRRPSWQGNCRDVVKSACLYGMGILKGPLVEKIQTKRFVRVNVTDEAGNPTGTKWEEQVFSEDLRPWQEAVSVWAIFPDPDAMTPQDLRYVWQTHLKSDKDMRDLANFPGFNGKAIRDYMLLEADGDATPANWESYILTLDDTNLKTGKLKNRYRVYERWGFLTGKDLADAGLDIPEGDYANVYSSNVWIIGEKIVKAYINPLEGIDIPYYFYPYQQDDTSFWPEGIPALLRAPQAGVNAVVRAMQDNAASSSMPILGINTAMLDSGDLQTMLADRVLLFRKSGVNIDHVMRATVVPSCIEHNLSLSQFWQNSADEISTPRFNAGDGNLKGAGETASGLSMLMGASNILLKDHIKDFDECIVSPFIHAMFRWNMQFSPRDDIKGDFEVTTSGSQSLIAKEVRAQQIPAIINYLNIPQFAAIINKRALLEVSLEQTDLPADRVLLTDEEAMQAGAEEAAMQAQAQVEALVQTLEKRGLPPEAVNQQLLLLMRQMQAQQQPLPGADGMGGMQ
jgi:hypothetical protein